jgi:hypothetical protein
MGDTTAEFAIGRRRENRGGRLLVSSRCTRTSRRASSWLQRTSGRRPRASFPVPASTLELQIRGRERKECLVHLNHRTVRLAVADALGRLRLSTKRQPPKMCIDHGSCNFERARQLMSLQQECGRAFKIFRIRKTDGHRGEPCRYISTSVSEKGHLYVIGSER